MKNTLYILIAYLSTAHIAQGSHEFTSLPQVQARSRILQNLIIRGFIQNTFYARNEQQEPVLHILLNNGTCINGANFKDQCIICTANTKENPLTCIRDIQ